MTHMQWAKERALEYLNKGELENALASFLSDVQKDEVTADLVGGPVGECMKSLAFAHVMRGNARDLREWIDGWADCGAEVN